VSSYTWLYDLHDCTLNSLFDHYVIVKHMQLHVWIPIMCVNSTFGHALNRSPVQTHGCTCLDSQLHLSGHAEHASCFGALCIHVSPCISLTAMFQISSKSSCKHYSHIPNKRICAAIYFLYKCTWYSPLLGSILLFISHMLLKYSFIHWPVFAWGDK